MKPESLIFDIDGTLWDSRAIIAEGYNEVLTQAGYPELCVTAEDLKKLFGKTMTEIGDILLATVPAEQRYPLMERCIEVGDGKLLDDPCDIALWSYRLQFTHPTSGEKMEFTMEPPEVYPWTEC